MLVSFVGTEDIYLVYSVLLCESGPMDKEHFWLLSVDEVLTLSQLVPPWERSAYLAQILPLGRRLGDTGPELPAAI